MTTALAKQIITRAKAKNISTLTLGREAGLKDHAVRNIILGKSRNPNAHTMQAIADVLGCTVRDLLTDQILFEEKNLNPTKGELRNTNYKYPDFLIEVASYVNSKVTQKEKLPSIHMVLTCIEEIYLNSIQKDPPTIDHRFADWFIKLMDE